MAKDAVATMGDKLPDEVQFGTRDAVHVATLAVRAVEKLYPGQDVGFALSENPRELERYVGVNSLKLIGIVDPFIKGAIMPDQRFWLFLYPRTITGLNHNWTHPDVSDDTSHVRAKVEVYATPAHFIESSNWMKSYANSLGIEYDDLMAGAKEFLEKGHYYSEAGTFEGMSTDDDFWDHYENITGKRVPADDRQSFFSCSC